jgi:hypothetical protein
MDRGTFKSFFMCVGIALEACGGAVTDEDIDLEAIVCPPEPTTSLRRGIGRVH